MNREQLWNRKIENLLHSFALLAGLALLLAVLGHTVFGAPGVALAVFVSLGALTVGSGISPQWIMRLHRARPLAPHEAPFLTRTVAELARLAELPSVPRLFYVPSAQPNAFAVGSSDHSALGLTDGLLRRLDHRELTGVLAHEISHIKNHDLRIMGLASVLTRMTRMLSFLGPVILFVTLPLALLGQARVPWLALLLLMVAPTFSALLQLALSRTRELNADLDAARLTRDPAGLASALAKLEAPAGSWLWRILRPQQRQQGSELLKSHPSTEERIRRLLSLAAVPARRQAAVSVPIRRTRRPERPPPRQPVRPVYVPVHRVYMARV